MPERLQSQNRTSGAYPVRMRTVTGRTILRLKSWGSGLAQTSPTIRIAGLELPPEVGATGTGELRALCTGPSDWLLVAPGPLSSPARAAIEGDSARQGLALTDLSSGLSVLEISGSVARPLLNRGCGLDLYPTAFPPGTCARTLFAQIPIVINFVQPPDRFELYAARSLVAYLNDWFTNVGSGVDAGSVLWA